ncbi:Putative type IIS restriction /modification enzyme, N-terminal half [hydrothermal vent metagenome]|uniref:site-specific DNA-methyltransferase (adenine-specific) n=1 Tax=hydrothermal vent metagenome TaxID=652676 RepID=A0A3B0UVK8_9ZZZZ
MDKQQASNHIRDTFEAPFEKRKFVPFVKNLLNQIEGAPFVYRGGTIPKAYRQYISTLERIGKYSDGEQHLDILIVRLKRETSLERARTMQRNFIAWYLNGSRGGVQKDVALVAFVSPSSADWRFSLVKMAYRFEELDGKVKVKEEFTPARRFSFLVGENENSHTAQSRLVPILIDDENNPTFAELEEAFNIEKVSAEFFQEYRRLFIWTKEELDAALERDVALKGEFEQKGINTVDFGKKLMGQIVFLYYLQKKGWFGVPIKGKWGDGSKRFLRELFAQKHGDYNNFFNDILEHLFYDALRNDRSHDDHYYGRFNCKIPFLNGGLFDPMGDYNWVTSDILLPNTLFSNQTQTKAGDTGDGILDVFDRFNFTVWEEEPLEKEVAVDPEMLGKVFENLLEVRDRKSKGAFYTPREIVHYMCQESLINYLDTATQTLRVSETLRVSRDDIAVLVRQGALALQHDAAKEAGLKRKEYVLPKTVRQQAAVLDTALKNIKICDPAIGSGAFPVGMLHEIVQARRALGTYLQKSDFSQKSDFLRTPYQLKRHAIQESIYGVDIDPGAVDIAKLRLWLSLVVDEEEIENIRPLPNLDYKIMCGNSLIELISPEFLTITSNQERSGLIATLKEAKSKLFNLTNPTQKRETRDEIERLIQQLFVNYKETRIITLQEKLDGLTRRGLFADAKLKRADLKKQRMLTAEINELKNLQLPAAAEHFEWRINFSEVFQAQGGFDVVIGNPPYVRHERIKEQKPALQKMHPAVYQGTADLYVYFYGQGINILHKDGFLAFITGNKFMRAGYGKKLRQFLATKTTPQILIDFGDLPVFDATAYPCIVVTKNAPAPADNIVSALTVQTVPQIEQITHVMAQQAWPMPQQKALTVAGWRLEPPQVLNLLDKLRDAGTPLGEYVNGRFYYGIKTGYNKAFVIDRATRDRLIAEHASSAEIIKPFLRGKDVKRWQVTFAEQYLIKIESSQNAQHPWSGKTNQAAEKIFAQTYPAIHAHFQQYQQQLIKRYDQGNYFWELRACTYWQEFEQPKIIYPDIAKRNEFAFDNDAYYLVNTLYLMPTNKMWLLGILNSKITFWFYTKISTQIRGGFVRFIAQYVSQIPIPAPSSPNLIEPLVTRILAAKKANPAANVAALEAEIDQLVYQLYGLSAAEIVLIEAQVNTT